jgi:hypothetical protein
VETTQKQEAFGVRAWECAFKCRFFFFCLLEQPWDCMADSVKAEQLIEYLNWCVLPLVLHVASHWYCYTYSDRNCYSMTKKWKSVVCDESAISWNLMKLESVYIIHIFHLVNKRNLFMCFYWNIHMSIRGSEIISFAFLPWMKVTRTNRVKNNLRLYYYYYYHHHHHHHHYFLSQVFFLPWYFSSWVSGEPHHSGLKSQLVALSIWCVMFLVWQFL